MSLIFTSRPVTDSHGDTSQAIFWKDLELRMRKQKACDTKQFNIKPNRQKRFPAT
jgi:hypothetical protein